jgi:hypothetical protein
LNSTPDLTTMFTGLFGNMASFAPDFFISQGGCLKSEQINSALLCENNQNLTYNNSMEERKWYDIDHGGPVFTDQGAGFMIPLSV